MGAGLPPIHERLIELLESTGARGTLCNELFRGVSLPDPRPGPQQLSTTMSGLESAEREVLRVHRHELAQLLQLAGAEVLRSRAPHPWLISPSLDMRREARALEGASFRGRVRRAAAKQSQWPGLSAAHAAPAPAPALALLLRCFLPSGRGWPGAVELYSASLRLEAQRSARIGLGLALGLQARYRAAREVLLASIDGFPSVLEHSLALQNLGAILRWSGDLQGSLVACRSAARLAIARPQVLVNWLDRGALVGAAREVRAAAQVLDALVPVDHICIERWRVALALRRRAEGQPPGGLTSRQALELARELGPTSRRILLAACVEDPESGG